MLPGPNATLPTGNLIPTHEALNIDRLTCRTCLKVFSQEQHRKRHEQDQHRLFEKRGRTISPLSFPLPDAPDLVSRPQSCPPPLFQSDFLTPERPIKRRKVSSVSATTSPAVSPQVSPPDSPLDSPIDSPLYSPLPSPRLLVTPNSSDVSSSETDSNVSGQSENVRYECPTCLINFKNKRGKNKHNCTFRYDHLFCEENNISPVVLTPPKNLQQTMNILSQLCQEDQLKLCILQDWCSGPLKKGNPEK